jgi:hypothetical protein
VSATRNMPGAVLICRLTRKRCACGKQTTAKQLVQYGVCISCIKAAAVAQRSGAAA